MFNSCILLTLDVLDVKQEACHLWVFAYAVSVKMHTGVLDAAGK